MRSQPRLRVDDQRGARAGERSETNIFLLVGDWNLENRQVALWCV